MEMSDGKELLQNLEQLHTTELGVKRIRNNLLPDTADVAQVVEWCKERIRQPEAVISRSGKNWYVEIGDCILTVNAYSYTIITAHKKKNCKSDSQKRQAEKLSDLNCITTFTGKHFDPLEPDADVIDIVDIAHALSLLCRGNGHVKTFFSVGQHCIHCALEAKARGYSKRVILACLLHDASECYMSDVPSPFKKSLLGYQKAEEKLLEIIYKKYLGTMITKEEEALVKEIDEDMLYFDLWELLGEKSDRDEPQMKSDFSYQVLAFDVVEQKYLELFYMYAGKTNREGEKAV